MFKLYVYLRLNESGSRHEVIRITCMPVTICFDWI